MADPIEQEIAALVAAGASDEEITQILGVGAEKPWTPGSDSLSGHMTRGPEVLSDTPSEPSIMTDAIEGLRGAAHPEGLSDISQLLIPGGITGAISGVKTLAKSLKGVLPGPVRQLPGRLLSRVKERFTSPSTLAQDAARDMPLYKQMDMLPETGPIPERKIGAPPSRSDVAPLPDLGPAPTPRLAEGIKEIPRRDPAWGKDTGALGKKGMLGDPKVPTSVYRQQLKEATVPATREWLAKVLAQRSSIDRSYAAKEIAAELAKRQTP